MNVFILGAGFSKPAGLPLGNELFADIISYAKPRVVFGSCVARSEKKKARSV